MNNRRINIIGIRGIFFAVTAAVLITVAFVQVRKLILDVTNGDLGVYVHAAQLFLKGENFYSISTHPGSPEGLFYLYPPIVAFLFIPFAQIDINVTIVTWTILNMFLVWWIVRSFNELISGKSLQTFSTKERWAMMAVPVLFTGRFILNNLQRGQVNILEIALLVLALKLIHENGSRSRSIFAGVVMGISIAIKALTLPFTLVFFLERKYLMFVGMFLGILICILAPATIIGFENDLFYHKFWIDNFLLDEAQRESRLLLKFNFSIKGQLMRFFSQVPGFELGGKFYSMMLLELTARQISSIDWIVRIGLIAPILVYWKKFGEQADIIVRMGLYALVFCLTPLFFPTTQKVYFVFLLPAYVFTVYAWSILKLKDRWFCGLMISSVIFATVFSDRNLFGSMSGVFEAAGCFILGALLLSAAVFRAVGCLTAAERRQL